MRTTKCGFDSANGLHGADLLTFHGPTLLVTIGFDETYDDKGVVPPRGDAQDVRALVDTGATESCIDSQLATTLNLPVVDRVRISGVGGAHEVNVYLAQIHVPALSFTLTGRFSGVHLSAGGQPHLALMGRTFLRHFTMVYEGMTGTVTLVAP